MTPEKVIVDLYGADDFSLADECSGEEYLALLRRLGRADTYESLSLKFASIMAFSAQLWNSKASFRVDVPLFIAAVTQSDARCE